jgi:hypothetical protein
MRQALNCSHTSKVLQSLSYKGTPVSILR